MKITKQNTKPKLLLYFILCTLFILANIQIAFADGETTGTFGTNNALVWKYDNGTLTISGTGAMPDYATGITPWDSYKDLITSAIIEGGVTYVGSRTFQMHTALSTVEMADTVKSTGNYLFNGCSSLASVKFSENLEEIIDGTFNNVTSLKAITVPYRTKVTANSFKKTASDMEITVYEGSDAHKWAEGGETEGITPDVANPDNTASGRMYKVEILTGDVTEGITWTLANDILTISGTGAIPDYTSGITPWDSYKDLITSAVIESGITYVGSRTFQLHTALESAEMADTVKSTGNYLFNGCSSLESVKFSENLEEIIDGTFNNVTSLKAITVPYRTKVTANSFKKTASDLEITVYEGSEAHKWAAGGETAGITPAVANADNTASGRSYKVEILTGDVTEGITWTLANGILTISGTGEMPNYNDGITPWDSCKDLITSAVIESGITYVGSRTFQSHSALESVEMADTVTDMGIYVFNSCSDLSSVVLSDNLSSISDGVFNRANSLTEITIPYNTSVSELSFRGTNTDLVIEVYNGSKAYEWAVGGEAANQTPGVLLPGSNDTAPRSYKVIANDGTAVDYFVGNYSAEDGQESIGIYSAEGCEDDIYVVFASYSSDQLTSVSIVKLTLSAGFTRVYSGSEFVPNENDKVKVMLWDTMDAIKPISNAFSNI